MTKTIRARTGDRGPPADAPEIYTVEKLGPKRARTANGNLICFDVPIARTGMLLYKAGEIPLKPDERGIIRVYRSAEELFSAKTIGSFMGVAVTDEHPETMEVTPRNWRSKAHGFSTTNVRRGEGDDSDVLFADLIITDKFLIEQIEAGKVEVSAGYESDYEQQGPGEGIQVNIIGNHIALVDRGRCGPRCAIGDHDPFNQPKGNDMTIRKRLTTAERTQRMRALVGDMETLMEDEGDPPSNGGSNAGTNSGDTHIHIHAGGAGGPGTGGEQVMGDQPAMPNTLTQDQPMGDPNAPAGGNIEARLAALEANIAKIMKMMAGGQGGDQAPDDQDPDAPADGDPAAELGEEEDPRTGDEFPEELKDQEDGKTGDELPVKDHIVAQKTGDSAALAKAYQKLLTDVEILVPGMRVPTFDHKFSRVKTVDRMCSIRRRALDAYSNTEHGKAAMTALTGDAALDDLDCAAIARAFTGAATAQRVLTNRKLTGDKLSVAEEEKPVQSGPPSAADINKANAEFWASRTF